MNPAILATLLALPPMTDSNYHGYPRHDLKVNGIDAIVVQPIKPAPDKPWIWRTEFFDHRPELDLALLSRGYHLVHLAVGNTFGAPEPMHQFSAFYREMTGAKWGLNRRVVLEGFSRGGLYAYNWAVRNPSKVMAIYGDAPVCDFRTWPYQRSEQDWKALIAAYGFPSEKAALEYPFSPVDNLAPLAAAHIPIIHVIGDADEVVPIGPNTTLIEQRYKALKGTIEVIHKPGGLHHPHSLDNPKPLVDFLLAHRDDSAQAPAGTTIAAPNPESRYDLAGWNGRSWTDQVADGKAEVPGAQWILIGDSITQGFGGPKRQVGAPGAASYEKWLAPLKTANLGISGDRTQHLLWRIEHGVLNGADPKVIAILIGINNYPDDSPEDVVKGIGAISQAARKKCPRARVVVQPLFPFGRTQTDPMRLWTNEINTKLESLAKKKAILLGFDQGYLLNADGSQNPDLFSPDAIHLAPAGYEPWAKRLSELSK